MQSYNNPASLTFYLKGEGKIWYKSCADYVKAHGGHKSVKES